MTNELQLTQVPASVIALLAREANRHHRSVEQEVLVLLEEALAARARARQPRRAEIDEILHGFDRLPDRDARPLADMIEYDALGLPK